jgi:hypothetical protein
VASSENFGYSHIFRINLSSCAVIIIDSHSDRAKTALLRVSDPTWLSKQVAGVAHVSCRFEQASEHQVEGVDLIRCYLSALSLGSPSKNFPYRLGGVASQSEGLIVVYHLEALFLYSKGALLSFPREVESGARVDRK